MLVSATQSFIGFFVFGFAGSFHCIGMCGPLAACARTGDCQSKFNQGLVSYFAVRWIAYGCLGLLAGYLGQMLFIKQMQIGSIFLWWIFVGLMMVFALHEIVQGLRSWRGASLTKVHHSSPLPRNELSRSRIAIGFISGKVIEISHALNRLILQSSRLPRSVALGLATALLPCGFLAMAVMQATTLANPLQAAVGLSGFALGTMPALWGGAAVTVFVRRIAPRAARLMIGLLLLLSSMGLMMRTNKISSSQSVELPADTGASSGQGGAKLPCH